MKVIHIRNKHTFESIVIGDKCIEVRLSTNFIKKLKVGEDVCFVCKESICEKKIKSIWYESSFEKMFEKLKYRLTDINPKLKNKDPLKYYEQYYPNKLNLGCVAFEICDI